jgi:hypothetical protein
MRRTISIHSYARVIALLALLLVDATHSTNAQPMSNAATMKTLWSDIRQFGVEGRGWDDAKSFYDRLPAKAEGVVRKPVWDLSRNSASMCVRFVTDATTVRARWALHRFVALPAEHDRHRQKRIGFICANRKRLALARRRPARRADG